MNKPTNIKVAIVSTGIILSFIFAFVYPVQPKETQAQFGGVTFNIKLKDLAKKAEDFKKKYGKWGDLAFQTLKKRYLIQIQNDLVNWVQGNGKPRFITNPKKFIKNEIKFATISTIDKFFLEQGSDICSPFKANVQFLVNRTKLLQEEQLRCNWTDVKKNMEAFANNFEDGGWTAWLKLHETRNTLPGTYLASTQLIGAEAALAGNTAIAKITAGKGFLDSKKCTKIEIPFYKIFFSEDTPYGGVHEVDLGNKLLAIDADGNYDWPLIFGESIDGVPITDVNIPSVRLTPTGESRIQDYDPKVGIPIGATCSEEETITPGSIVGDWVGGGLEKLSLDPLINAKELGEIVNAVIDAAVNRAARTGLSKMNSGPGSYTQATKAGGAGYYGQAAILPPVIGAESPVSSDLLNRVLSFQNNVQKLSTQLSSLTRGENTIGTFKQKLEGFNFKTTGGLNDADDIIDLQYERAKLNDESKNPGPYLANQALNEVTASKWDSIIQTLKSFNSAESDQLRNSCSSKISDVRFFEHPKKEDMPFTDKEGKIVKVTNTVNIYYQLLFTRSPGEENDGLVETTPTTWKKEYLSLALTRAGSNKNLYLNIANSYTGLIDNAKKLLATFQNDIEGDGDDMEYMNSVLPVISQYDSLLTDYDSAARETGALGALQNYVELRDQTENEAELTDLRKTAMDSQRNARNTWKINLEKIRDSDQTPPDEKAKAKTKVEIIDKTLILVEASLKNTLTSHFDELKETFGIEEKSDINKMNIDRVLDLISKMPSIDFLQEVKSIGTATAESLTITTITEGVTTSKPFNVDKIDSELTEREGKISTHQSEITDAIGEFLPTKETVAGSRDENVESRKTLGVKGGDNEWEKYYYNRFQLAYATYIDDFYKNWFKCPLPSWQTQNDQNDGD